MKKIVSFILSLLMVFTLATSAIAAPADQKLHQSNPQRTITNNATKLKADARTENLKDSDQVRVIVELKGKPAIDYATERGVKVTQLDQSYLKSITTGITMEQNTVRQRITSKRIPVRYHFSFSNVANGFSATVSFKDAKEIEAMPEVSRVVIANEYDRPEPDMGSSKDIVKAIETWNLGYNGQGTVISIIDTGIDYDHKDMRLTDPSKAKLNQRSVNNIIDANRLKGKWYTSKVPYGYNYYDNNNIVKDLGPGASMHGMHVAGIAGANGIDATGVKGVAPEAQLLAMKVFSNDPNFGSTFSDIYLAAIEDSIKLGVDAINMSLGSTASFQRPDDPEQVALTRATENGIVLAMSAGNAGHIGYGFAYKPYAKNPDLGVVGAPGLNANSIQVASIENTNIFADAISYKNGLIGYTMSGPTNPINAFSGQVEYVYCKLGLIGTSNGVPVDDFAGVNVAGKIALIMRGGYTDIPGNFVDKVTNAQNKGAIGVIVFNHSSGGEELINMAYPDGVCNIPAVFIGYKGGSALNALIATGENKVEFKGEKISVANPNSGKMSAFTSWGTTPNLDFKPELTAPGGNIYSTFNNNSYGIMSGTSMAAPHVAGGSALILQRVDKEFGLTGYNRSLMAKNLLLSTANPIVDKGLYNNYYGTGTLVSPRIQGAGVMNLQAAATTPAIVTDTSTGVSKVNLKEMGRVETFRLKVSNFSDNPVAYKLSGTVTTDMVADGEILGEAQGIYRAGTIRPTKPYTGEFPISYTQNGAPISSITVPANGTTEFDVTVDLTNAIDWMNNEPIDSLFENGAFIEGFVTLKSADDTQPTIGIPYMGFYGEWDKAPIIDDNNYDQDAMPFYNYNTVLTWLNTAEDMYYFLGYDFDGNPDADNISFSPNGDGRADHVRFLGTFLRNASEFEINILDSNGNVVRRLTKEYEIRKNFYDAGDGSMFTSLDSWAWDGTINYKKAPDGKYTYQIKAKIDYPNAEWQTVEFPVKVDTQAPGIQSIEYNQTAKQLTAKATDNHAVCYYELVKDGTTITANDTGIFDVSELVKLNERNIFTVKAYDFAENSSEKTYEIIQSNDTEAPAIFVNQPEVLGIYKSSQVLTSGYVTDNSQIREFKINGEIVPTTFDAATKRYAFEKQLTITDGSFRIKYAATDIAGNLMSIERKIFVDTKAPQINLTIPEAVDQDVDKLQIIGTVTDNMPGLKVFVNSNMVYNSNASWMYIEGETPVTYDFTGCEPVALEYGNNIITIEARDDAGNVTIKQYNVFRRNEAPLSIVKASVYPNQYVSSQNPAVISAEANFAVDWEVKVFNSKGLVVKTFNLQGSKTFTANWVPSLNDLAGNYIVEIKAVRGAETQLVSIPVTIRSSRNR